MSGAIRCVAICNFIAIAALGTTGCGSSRVAIVRVSGSAVSMAELNHWASIDRAMDGRAIRGNAGLKERVLDFLISSQWLIGEAGELGVKVSDEEAREQLSVLRFDQVEGRPYEGLSRDPELNRFLLAPRVGMSDRLWLMKLNILAMHIEQMRTSRALREVTEAQITRYYDKNRSHLLDPEKRDVEIIMTKREAGVRKAKREIQSGKSFMSVSKRVNVSPEGGLHLGLARGAGEKLFEKVVFAAKPHVLIGPVKQQLYYVFEVLKVTPAQEQTLAQAQTSIRRLLAVHLALPRLTHVVEAKWIARTNCLPAYVVMKCRQYEATATSTPQHEQTVIRVERSTITKSALDHWMSVMAPRHAMPEPPRFTACVTHLKELVQYPTSQAQLTKACRAQYWELRQSALHFLITSEWLIGEAADLGMRVSSHEIDRGLREKYASPERQVELKELLAFGGHTMSDIELEVQAELAAKEIRQRLLSYSLKVSRSQIVSYYRHAPRRFYLPERRYVAMIGNLRHSTTVKKIIGRIRHGASFASMSFNEWLERPNFANISSEKGIFYRAIFRSRPNVIVGPLRINGYYFLFKVTKISPARIPSLAESGDKIKEELSVRRRVRFVDAWRKRWTAETSCAPAYVVQKCKQYHGPSTPEDPLDVN
jgi:hypothetical protein